jgi:hypothetical protein
MEISDSFAVLLLGTILFISFQYLGINLNVSKKSNDSGTKTPSLKKGAKAAIFFPDSIPEGCKECAKSKDGLTCDNALLKKIQDSELGGEEFFGKAFTSDGWDYTYRLSTGATIFHCSLRSYTRLSADPPCW